VIPKGCRFEHLFQVVAYPGSLARLAAATRGAPRHHVRTTRTAWACPRAPTTCTHAHDPSGRIVQLDWGGYRSPPRLGGNTGPRVRRASGGGPPPRRSISHPTLGPLSVSLSAELHAGKGGMAHNAVRDTNNAELGRIRRLRPRAANPQYTGGTSRLATRLPRRTRVGSSRRSGRRSPH
jgi:hypothetical protein